MGRLYNSLFVLLLVFSAAMSFVTLGVYVSQWWWSVIGVAILLVFVALGGLLVPSAQKAVAPADRATASAAVQVLGAVCACEFFIMAIVTWVVGNKTLFDNNAYQALGLLLFLGLIGIGIQGVLFTLARFVYVRNEARVQAAHHAVA
ncbi:MAG TPA: hypothetical protein VMB82_09675 [Acidimicrobiales bacterium]|nr:hypothetical protein [Acidimicrobiales bacterium]